ncbi:MAG: resolvase, partial [Halobacteriaceae archaeon]
LADEVAPFDLGVQTGFSRLSRDDDGLLDDVPAVQQAVEDLRDGVYDVLVAYDDRRICRDEYLNVIEYACVQGGCEIAFVSDNVETDDLAYDIHRRVERKTKEEEITKAKAAVEERQSRGCYQGRPPIGLQFADDGCHLERSDRWDDVERVFELLSDGEPYSAIEEATGFDAPTISRMNQRGIEWYRAKLAEYGLEDTNLPAQNPG